MVWLGLRLSLRSGREALIRLVLTALAVGIGAALLFCVLADYHAFQTSNNRQCWECTGGPPSSGTATPTPGAELWQSTADYFDGQTIERLDLAALGPHAPLPPGLSRMPGPGQYYASPALAALLRTVPRDELGDRYPGRLVGTIGDKALTGPDELVIFIGYKPATLAAMGAQVVTKIATAPPKQVWTPYFRYAFAVGVLAVLFPMLILVGTATRLAAARREERYAAMRLVGATPRQISVVASIDAMVSALLGVLLGIGIFALVQPALANASLIGTRYFAFDVTPTATDYIGMLVGVPVVSAIAALLSLRRVRISPLGVARRVTPPPPSIWRVLPLLIGIGLFVGGLAITNKQSIGGPAYPGLLVTMIGLVIAGPWLTAQAARLFARLVKGPSPLLAARRLADNPKVAFRTVTGLVLAVFLGTIVAGLLPAVNATTATPSANGLNNVLLDTFGGGAGPFGPAGLAPHASTTLLGELKGFKGATTYPVYALPQSQQPKVKPQGGVRHRGHPGGGGGGGPQGPTYDSIISCASLKGLAVLGRCAPGTQAVKVTASSLLFSDNPTFSTQPIASASNPAVPDNFSHLYLEAVLVRVHNSATLERVRTFLDTHTPQNGSNPPKTFGEAVQIRLAYADTVSRLVYIAVALTLLVAGCSLAVTVGGNLVERKRPFTLLRVSGTPTATLYRVVLLEAVLPLAAATVVAAGTAYGISVLTVDRMAPAGTPTPTLGHVYFATMGVGLLISLLVILVTMPVLGRMTAPSNVRFE
jgi:FtsX-like permease family